MSFRPLVLAALLAGAPLAAKPSAVPHAGTVDIHLLALNDLHGHISPDRSVTVDGIKQPAGGVAYIAAMFRKEREAHPHTFLVDAGDMVGASPPESALFQDEPVVEFMNMVHWDISTLGNHEFDEGVPELRRLWKGGAHKASRYYPKPFAGAKFPILCSNILDSKTGQPLFPPYIVKNVDGVRIGFIGVDTGDLANVVSPAALKGVTVVQPVDAINKWAAHLEKYGVHAIVVLIHEGGKQTPATPQGTLIGTIVDIAQHMDKDVDVLVSGHSHQYTNAFVGRVLITQARSMGDAYASIDLTVDRASDEIVKKRADIVPTLHEGVTPDPDVAQMVNEYVRLAAPRVNQVVGHLSADMSKSEDHGEGALGDLIADAQREALHADIAFMNAGGIRATLKPGPVTWGELYSVQPFNDLLLRLTMTGAQIKGVLEQQWGAGTGGDPRAEILYVSGLTYTYDPQAPIGGRLVDVTGPDGQPLADDKSYTVAVNDFTAAGGDGFSKFKEITAREPGPVDLDALIDYFKAHPDPTPQTGRVRATR